MTATMLVEVFTLRDQPLEVRCVAKAQSNKLEIEHVTFHALSDAQYRQIVDAIETYLLRKQLRDRERAKLGPDQEPGGSSQVPE